MHILSKKGQATIELVEMYIDSFPVSQKVLDVFAERVQSGSLSMTLVQVESAFPMQFFESLRSYSKKL